MSDRDRSSPSLTDTPLKTYIGRHDDDYPLINGNGHSLISGTVTLYFSVLSLITNISNRS